MLSTRSIIAISSFFAIIILAFSVIGFNNTVIVLDEKITNELETTKLQYSQCLISIKELNSVSVAYRNDLLSITTGALENLDAFNNQVMTRLNTNFIPNISPDLRKAVQTQIITCRNEFVNKSNLMLKPMFTVYNTSISTFPGSLYNVFLGHSKKEFKLHQSEDVTKAFETGIDKPLDLQ